MKTLPVVFLVLLAHTFAFTHCSGDPPQSTLRLSTVTTALQFARHRDSISFTIRFGEKREELGVAFPAGPSGKPLVPASVGLDNQGRIAILDQLKGRIAVFSVVEGRLIRELPADRMSVDFTFLPDGAYAVYIQPSAKIVLYSPNGRQITSHSLPPGLSGAIRLDFLQDLLLLTTQYQEAYLVSSLNGSTVPRWALEGVLGFDGLMRQLVCRPPRPLAKLDTCSLHVLTNSNLKGGKTQVAKVLPVQLHCHGARLLGTAIGGTTVVVCDSFDPTPGKLRVSRSLMFYGPTGELLRELPIGEPPDGMFRPVRLHSQRIVWVEKHGQGIVVHKLELGKAL